MKSQKSQLEIQWKETVELPQQFPPAEAKTTEGEGDICS